MPSGFAILGASVFHDSCAPFLAPMLAATLAFPLSVHLRCKRPKRTQPNARVADSGNLSLLKDMPFENLWKQARQQIDKIFANDIHRFRNRSIRFDTIQRREQLGN